MATGFAMPPPIWPQAISDERRNQTDHHPIIGCAYDGIEKGRCAVETAYHRQPI